MMKTIEFLEFILKGMSVHPQDITIEEYFTGNKTMFYVRCNSADKGRIIGKDGRTIKAIQQVTYSYLRKDCNESEINTDVLRMSVEGIN